MNRREFLKGTLMAAALAPVAKLAAKAGADGNKTSDLAKGSQVTRRRYRDTAMTLPMLGFGMMRMPRLDPGRPDIDYATAAKQIARALEAGVNYFDTAYFYHNGLREKCAGDLLTKFPRDSYYLASKMPVRAVRSEADVKRIFEEQLAKCKTEYFDFYLLHNLNQARWKDVIRFKIYEFLKQKQKEGKIRKLGFSFHDKPEVLEVIAKAHPWDFAQIQLNYFDWDDYSREQYEILTSHGIPVVVMEPLKGGELANLQPKTLEMLTTARPGTTAAQWAFEFIASLPNVLTILSGMTYMEHVEENLKTFSPIEPLGEEGKELLVKVKEFMKEEGKIPCTTCRYCTPCPVGVAIPDIFKMYNNYRSSLVKWMSQREYFQLEKGSRADACVECGACLKKCPQKINIPEELKRVHKEFTS